MSNDIFKNIIDLIKEGDSETLQKVYVENREPFIKFSKKYNICKHDALDIYQDAIIILKENIMNGKIQELNSNISTYLFAIGKYKIFQSHRNNSKVELVSDIYIKEENLRLDVDFHDEIVTNQQRQINDLLPLLSPKCIKILNLFYYEGYTLDEITEILESSDKNVLKSQKSRCIKKLKNLIKKKYG